MFTGQLMALPQGDTFSCVCVCVCVYVFIWLHRVLVVAHRLSNCGPGHLLVCVCVCVCVCIFGCIGS